MKSVFATAVMIISLVACNTPEERVKQAPETKDQAHVETAPVENKTDTVLIKEMKFQPAVLTVTKGTMVIFLNKDMVTHDVTEEETKAWSSKLLPPHKSWSMVADQSADYYCSIHAVMKGKIVVRH